MRALLKSQADTAAKRLLLALMHGDVSGVFQPMESPPPPVLLMDGDPMEGDDLRNLAQALASMRFFSDKLTLIRRRVRSMGDITWLMESGCLTELEMTRLFSMFGKEELAALMRMGRGRMLMQGRWIFPEPEALPEGAPLWGKCLYGYLAGLDFRIARRFS